MKRRDLIAAGLLAPLCAMRARAQQHMVRIGILAYASKAEFGDQENAFVDAMRDLGWTEGRNVVYERAYANLDRKRLRELARAMVARKPHLVFTMPTSAAVAAFEVTRSMPIVCGAFTNPVTAGLAKSLNHPGYNVTGIANIAIELGAKRLQLLLQTLPSATAIGVVAHPAESIDEVELIKDAARKLHAALVPLVASTAQEIAVALKSLPKQRIQALLTTASGPLYYSRRVYMETAAAMNIPVFAHRSEFAAEGAVLSYGTNILAQVRRAAEIAGKILNGAAAGDIPIEQPATFELVVNLKAAKSFGIRFPGSIMVQATKVIE